VPKRDEAHDVDGLGLAAMIYSNRGVACSKTQPPQRWAAVRCYLSALTLDPLDESATGNLLAVFTNWGPELTADEEFEAALRVLSFGLSLAPDTDALQRNQTHAWAAYIEATLEAGDDERALALVRRAAATTKDRDFDAASAWFIRHGEQRHKEDWEAALGVADRGLKALPATDRPALLKWRSGVFRRRSQWLLEPEQGPDVAGSMQVLARAHALDTGDESTIAGIAYHTQEALPLLERRSGVKAMSEHFAALRREFPRVKEVAELGRAHAQRAVLKLADEKKFGDAVAAVARYEPLYTRPDDRDELGGLAYDRWAQDLAGRQEWHAALDKCAEGLQVFPMQTAAVKRIRITVDNWARPAIEAKKWDEAIRIYDVGLEYARDDAHLRRNREYCEKMQQQGK
jgi:tetratricopeptide (TPR) repeat protein